MKVTKVEYYSKGFYRITLLDDKTKTWHTIFVDQSRIQNAFSKPQEKKQTN